MWATEKKHPFADAIRWGVAADTASSALPGMVFTDLDQTKATYQSVIVRSVR